MVAAEYVPSTNAALVPLVEAPTATPTPTETPSPTPTPEATGTPIPTSTPEPATATPTPSPTPTSPPETTISFSAVPLSIEKGACTTFSWLVTNVKAVYFQGEGVAGDADGLPVERQECPTQTTTYGLRVVKLDDTEETREITITVASKPDAPSDLALVQALPDALSLSWVDNSTDETGFRLYDADSNAVRATFNADATGGTISGLTCGTTYNLYLVAFNDVGESSPGNTLTVTTTACP